MITGHSKDMQKKRLFLYFKSRLLKTPIKNITGSVLLLVIVLMVVIAIIGVGMMSMFSSSVFSVFSSNSARRAQYLAESGIRYALSEVRNANSSLKEATLINIDDGSADGKWFQAMPDIATFNIRVYPLFSNTSAGTGTATITITAAVSNSGFPPGYSIPGVGSTARLHVGPNNPVGITSVSGAAAGSKNITYALSSPVIIPNGTIQKALLAFPTTNVSQTITKNSEVTPLSININTVSAIPQKNGAFMDAVSGKLYTYRTAKVVSSTVQLKNINWTGTGNSITFPVNTYLSFTSAVRLDSKGKHNQTEKSLTDYITLFTFTSQTTPPQNLAPPALTPTASGFTNDLSALDLSQSGNKVAIQGYITIGGTHPFWAAFQGLGEAGNRFIDPEEPGRYIGYHVAPGSTDISDNLRNIWMQYNQLNYDVQIKMGWDLNLDYAGQGITFRWHESSPGSGLYEGYGICFMLYKDDNRGSDDYIPNNVKPPDVSLKKNLLIVLWEQKVSGGVETKDWIAYALLGDPSDDNRSKNKPYHDPEIEGQRKQADPDQKVTGYQVWPDGRLNDDAGIIVRVEDKFIDSIRYNEIKLFYTDASKYNFNNDSRTKDNIATNKQRARYYPKWLEGLVGTGAIINPKWPSNQFGMT